MNLKWSAAFALLFIAGCGPVEDAPPKPVPTNEASASPAAINPALIALVDGTMERSKTFRIDGDLRPFWIVSGRIENHSDMELERVTFRISINSKASSTAVDTATFVVDTDIPPHSTGSFKREIQILPPSSAWGWSYAVVEAVSK
jgi:hypothetical protein